jgi:hypothetical protein
LTINNLNKKIAQFEELRYPCTLVCKVRILSLLAVSFKHPQNNMNNKKIITFLILLICTIDTYCQDFEGKLNYRNIYLKMGTQDLLFEPIPQIEFYKGGLRKIEIPNSADGQMEWQIENYQTKAGYIKFSDKRIDTSYIVTDEPLTYQKDGKTYFKKPKSEKKLQPKPIKKYDLCNKFVDTTTFKKLDTTFVIAGLKSNLIFEYRGDKVVTQYYYCDTIKLNPKFYECNSQFSRFYKMTNGALITQYVNYEVDGYDFIYQLTGISIEKVNEKIFEIPTLKEK